MRNVLLIFSVFFTSVFGNVHCSEYIVQERRANLSAVQRECIMQACIQYTIKAIKERELGDECIDRIKDYNVRDCIKDLISGVIGGACGADIKSSAISAIVSILENHLLSAVDEVSAALMHYNNSSKYKVKAEILEECLWFDEVPHIEFDTKGKRCEALNFETSQRMFNAMVSYYFESNKLMKDVLSQITDLGKTKEGYKSDFFMYTACQILRESIQKEYVECKRLYAPQNAYVGVYQLEISNEALKHDILSKLAKACCYEKTCDLILQSLRRKEIVARRWENYEPPSSGFDFYDNPKKRIQAWENGYFFYLGFHNLFTY